MSQLQKMFSQVLGGRSDANIAFTDLCRLLERLGFVERTGGSHHIFTHQGVEERINLQESGTNAKPYQVKQVRAVIIRYGLEVTR
ncbi:MAG: type II toxin-antitoxin system HicA family toxin [Rhodanobacteraceae bacterium]